MYSQRIANRSVAFLVFLGLLSLIPICTIAFPAMADDPDPKNQLVVPRQDQPGEAARFRAVLVSGGEVEDRPIEVPPTAITKAIQQVRILRQVASQRFNLAPQAMMLDAGRGRSSKIAGIPVGPLAASNLPLELVDNPRPAAIPLSAMGSLDPTGWRWIGPGNIGGRTRAIVIHPLEPQTIWLGGVAGGIWRTTDGGLTWAPMADFMANMAISCMAIDPTNPNRLYAGTGEGFNNLGSVRGFGIFVSDDGGLTWNQLESTSGADAEQFRYINRIAIAKVENEIIMLVATSTGLYRSDNQGKTFKKVGGVLDNTVNILDVGFSSLDPKLCAATHEGQVYYSSNAGVQWDKSTGIPATEARTIRGGIYNIPPRIELTFAKENPSTVYASVDVKEGTVYRSQDGGKTFSIRGNPRFFSPFGSYGYLSQQGWYANAIWAGDPKNKDLIIVGGLNLCRSVDGGLTFTEISDWTKTNKPNTPPSPHADNHIVVSGPNYNGEDNFTVYCGNDGGIYRAMNIKTATSSSGWQSLNNGLGITQFYGIAVNQKTGKVIAGAQDNGTLVLNESASTESWKEIFGGDGGFAAAHPTDSHFFSEYVFLQIHRGDGTKESGYISQGIADDNPLFIAPFILDPNDPKSLLAGGSGLWRTKDCTIGNSINPQTRAWVPQPTFELIKETVPKNSISAISIAKGNSKLIWVGYANNNNIQGRVHRTKGTAADNGWLPALKDLPERYVSRIIIDPTDSNTVYVLFTGYEEDNLHMTKDGGKTWAPLGKNVLPAVPFFDLAIHPDNPKHLYLGTDVGLFVSDDGGTTWLPTNQGPTNAPVQNLVWKAKILYAGTYGRGVFYIDLSPRRAMPVTPVIPRGTTTVPP